MNSNWIWTGFGVLALVGVVFTLFRVLDPNAIEDLRKDWQVEAKYQLSYICNLEKAYFEKNNKYSTDLETLGFFQEEGSADFWVEVVGADSSDFLARAYAMRDFDNDGELNVWETQKNCLPREIVED